MVSPRRGIKACFMILRKEYGFVAAHFIYNHPG